MYTDADLENLKQCLATYNAWMAGADFEPVKADPYDVYPDDFLAVATQPSKLSALIERLERAEASSCTARLKRIGRVVTRCLLLRFPLVGPDVNRS